MTDQVHRIDARDGILLYTLKDYRNHRGRSIQVNDVMIRIENANGSTHNLSPLADVVQEAWEGYQAASASRDVLAALESIVNELTHGGCPSNLMPELREARAAIAKAKGEEP